NVGEHLTFRRRKIALAQNRAERRARQRIRDGRMAGNARRSMVSRCARPTTPPLHPAIQVGGGSPRTPRGSGRSGPVSSQHEPGRKKRQNSGEKRGGQASHVSPVRRRRGRNLTPPPSLRRSAGRVTKWWSPEG